MRMARKNKRWGSWSVQIVETPKGARVYAARSKGEWEDRSELKQYEIVIVEDSPVLEIGLRWSDAAETRARGEIPEDILADAMSTAKMLHAAGKLLEYKKGRV